MKKLWKKGKNSKKLERKGERAKEREKKGQRKGHSFRELSSHVKGSDLQFHSAVHFPYMDNKAYLGLYLIFFSQNDVHKYSGVWRSATNVCGGLGTLLASSRVKI